MTLTLANLQSIGVHALGGGYPAVIDTDGPTTLTRYINEAGRFLFNMANWPWAERPSTDLDFTASQSYVTLPTDFGQLLAYAGQNNIARPLRMTTMQEILTLRKSFLVTTWTYFSCLTNPTQAGNTSAPTVPRMELYPTPAASVTAAMTIQYRARWVDIAAANTTYAANVPADVEVLLAELVRAYVKGVEEDALQDFLARVVAGPVAQRLLAYYGDQQPDVGPPENGALMSSRVGYPSPQQFQPATVTGP